MSYYDYKVVPAPKRAKKVKGVKTPEELFAVTLTDAINEVARQGWEYVRAEHMPAEASRRLVPQRPSRASRRVLVFRRQREGLGPRLATVRSDVRPDPHTEGAPDAPLSDLPAAAPRAEAPHAERAVIDRMRRREPSVRLEPVPGDEPTRRPRSGPPRGSAPPTRPRSRRGRRRRRRGGRVSLGREPL